MFQNSVENLGVNIGDIVELTIFNKKGFVRSIRKVYNSYNRDCSWYEIVPFEYRKSTDVYEMSILDYGRKWVKP